MTRSLIESTALSTVSLSLDAPNSLYSDCIVSQWLTIPNPLLQTSCLPYQRGSLSYLHRYLPSTSFNPHLSPLPTKYPQNSDAQGQLTAAVDDLLNELQSKFDNVSTEMFGKRESPQLSSAVTYLRRHTNLCLYAVDDMTKRLDELEASLAASSSAGAPSQAK